MSAKSKNMDNFTDATSRVAGVTDEEKIFESSTTDEGFISEEISEELLSTKSEGHCDSGLEDIKKEVIEEEAMRVDSGILSESFSNLSIKNSGLNDLNAPQKILNSDLKIEKAEQKPLYFQQDEDGDTYLHIAIIKGFLEVALALIRSAPHPKYLDTRNDFAQSPLHLAVATGQYKIVRWLIVAGAKPSPRNRYGDSPLHIAARTGDVACCKAILEPVHQQERDNLALSYPLHAYETCQLDQWNFDGQTSVHVAAMSGNVQVLQHLIWNGADVNAREGLEGYTALHIAIQRGDERLARFLLCECSSLDPKVLTYGKRSALQLGYPVNRALFDALRERGVDSPFSSEDEFNDSSDEEEMPYENQNMFIPKLVNANA